MYRSNQLSPTSCCACWCAGLLTPGATETDIDKQVFNLAASDYGTRKHWHQRLPRIGQNTIHPIYEKVPDLALMQDDIVYLDLGPVFGDMEADFGRTYVLGELTFFRTLLKVLQYLVGLASDSNTAC